MQINSNRPADYYPLVTNDKRSSVRLPVVYQEKTEIKPVVSDQNADTTKVVVATNQNQDGQQARFVRDFIASDRQFGGNNPSTQLLPPAVQQYIFIDEIPNQTASAQGQFLDEIV
jgi:hypothetical protein